MNTLYTFGCSYSEDFENLSETLHNGKKPTQLRYVDEILNGVKPPTWPKVLGNLLNYEVINKAQGGSSNYQIFNNVCELSHMFKKDDIVIIQWTQNSRFRWPSDGGWIPVLPNLFHELNEMSIITYEETLVSRTHKLFREEIYNYQNIINSLSKSVGNKIFYWAADDKLINELPKDKKYILSEFFDYERKIGIPEIFYNNGVRTITQETMGKISDGHYGKIGHQRIAELFYDYIKNIK